MSHSAEVATGQLVETRSTDRAAIRPALFAAVLGFAILYVVGFAQPAMIHDAAHDARHSAAFPCH